MRIYTIVGGVNGVGKSSFTGVVKERTTCNNPRSAPKEADRGVRFLLSFFPGRIGFLPVR